MGILGSRPRIHNTSVRRALLVDEEPEVMLRTGDLLLVAHENPNVLLYDELWTHVGIVFHVRRGERADVYVFSDGRCVPLTVFLSQYRHVACRPLQCARPRGFDRRVSDAVERTRRLLTRRRYMSIKYRAGFCAGAVLGILGLVPLEQLMPGKLTPSHFSPSYRRLTLVDYARQPFRLTS